MNRLFKIIVVISIVALGCQNSRSKENSREKLFRKYYDEFEEVSLPILDSRKVFEQIQKNVDTTLTPELPKPPVNYYIFDSAFLHSSNYSANHYFYKFDWHTAIAKYGMNIIKLVGNFRFYAIILRPSSIDKPFDNEYRLFIIDSKTLSIISQLTLSAESFENYEVSSSIDNGFKIYLAYFLSSPIILKRDDEHLNNFVSIVTYKDCYKVSDSGEIICVRKKYDLNNCYGKLVKGKFRYPINLPKEFY